MAGGPVSSTVRAVELGLRLRARRDQLGLTAASVGRTTGIGGNNLSSIEIAKRRLTSTKLAELASIYELSATELAELDALRVEADRRGWWEDYARLYSDEFLRFLGLEAGASRQREYAAEVVPGLLQTADYARAMVRGGSPYIKPVDVEARVASRLARQAVLDGPDGPVFTVLIGQTALRQEVGGRAVLRGQLAALGDAIEARPDHLRVHVLPYGAGSHPVIGGGLKILSFDSPWLPDMVWQESVTAGNLLDKPHIVAELVASFDESVDRALDLTASLDMIRRVHGEMGS